MTNVVGRLQIKKYLYFHFLNLAAQRILSINIDIFHKIRKELPSLCIRNLVFLIENLQ